MDLVNRLLLHVLTLKQILVALDANVDIDDAQRKRLEDPRCKTKTLWVVFDDC